MGLNDRDELSGWTRETPAEGLVCWQPRRGYRYGVEAYALASFAIDGMPGAEADPGGARRRVMHSVLDLGAGSGIVSILLASRGARVVAVELDERWRPGLERSIRESALEIPVLWGDVRALDLPGVDMVVCNPPWFRPESGPLSPDDHKAHARTALQGGPAEFIRAGLRAAPRVCLVVPASTGLPAVAEAVLARHGRVGGLVLGEYSRVRAVQTLEVPVDPYRPFQEFRGG